MKRFIRAPLSLMLYTILFNVLIISATLLLHESGHFLTGVYAGCMNIRLVLIDSELGTYTEMSCPHEQAFYFPMVGAFLLILPFSLLFLLLKEFPERHLIWICLGFNLIIAVADFPAFAPLQFFIFFLGVCLVVLGEILLIDKLLLLIIRR